ncbi:MAG: DUF4331 domain-containing protein [Polyangiaceae bacterium]
MRNRTLISSGLVLATLAALGTSLVSDDARASSHREAPFITKNPKVDGTDFYMFKSYEAGRSDYVTLIANYIPLQNQYGGPNFFSMDPEALYEIHLDNTGDAKQDITFQFRFQSSLAGTKLKIGDKMVAIPLINSGPVTGDGLSDPQNANLSETYTIKVLKGDSATGTATDVVSASNPAVKTFRKPLDYIGQKSFGGPAAYEAYARKHIFEVRIDGCATNARVFVGQRKETFAVNLGVIFDLVNVDALGLPAVAQPLADILDPAKTNRAKFANPIANTNITSIELEVPIACVTGSAKAGAAADAGKIIGAWQTASVRQARVINPGPSFAKPTVEGGAWAQVSRLGFPLINEAVIGLPDKDKFNSSMPKDDLTNFADYVTNPTLPALLEILFGTAGYAAPKVPRDDMVAAAVTGVAGVNMPVGGAAGEMQRLNVAFAPKALKDQFALGAAGCFLGTIVANTNPYGIDTANAACDPNGFPNGRRPLDDVTDVILSVVATDFLRTAAANKVVLHDGVAEEAGFRDAAGVAVFPGAEVFPYLPTPNGGT